MMRAIVVFLAVFGLFGQTRDIWIPSDSDRSGPIRFFVCNDNPAKSLPVLAVVNGEVKGIKKIDGLLYITFVDEWKYRMIYGGLALVSVVVGEKVAKGGTIGELPKKKGRSLYFAIVAPASSVLSGKDVYIDPRPYFPPVRAECRETAR